MEEVRASSVNSRVRSNSAVDSSTGAIIDKMMDTTSSLKLFALEKKLLNDSSITDGERLRWRVSKVWSKKTVTWSGVACSALVSLLRFVGFLLFLVIGAFTLFALILLSGLNKNLGIEWMLFSLSILSVIVQEVLRKRWEAKEQFEVLRFRYTRDGNDDDDETTEEDTYL